MEAMTKSWTDERLEERFDRIDQRFDEVDRRFESVDRRFDEINHRFNRVELDLRELRGEVHTGFERIGARFEALHRTLLQLGGVTIAALLGLLATQL
jgi:DNA anti-recombination protein RmuC